MLFTDVLRARLTQLLEEKRVVVWYDGEGDFRTFVEGFESANCEVVMVEPSVLSARLRADYAYSVINEAEAGVPTDARLLIYTGRPRGVTETEKMTDPFEVYAVIGAAFGDTEDERLESLARQAMPHRSEEITRLFAEGRPDLALLDALDRTSRWPILRKIFHTEAPADVIALTLCSSELAAVVDDTPGCLQELLRLLESAVGFKSDTRARHWSAIRPKLAEFVLFSEFVLDLPSGLPEALAAVPRADEKSRSTVCAVCDRMRADSHLSEAYMALAQAVEAELHLPQLMPDGFEPGTRDTFAFEERRLLGRAVEALLAGDSGAVRTVCEGRRASIWRQQAERTSAWVTVERALTSIEASLRVTTELPGAKTLKNLVQNYVKATWSDLDRAYRLFEAALTACTDEDALAPAVDLCRRRYREAAEALQDRLLKSVEKEGWPPEGVPRQTGVFDEHVKPALERREKTAFFLVDSLRYEMGRDLAEALEGAGGVALSHAAVVPPTVTPTGMAALMPGANGALRLVESGGGLAPSLGDRVLSGSQDRMKLLAEIYGDRFAETTLDDLLGALPKKLSAKLEGIDLFVVRTQDPDAIAENLGPWRARRYLSEVVGDIAAAVRKVKNLEFTYVVIAADHGHVMLSESAPGDVVQSPPGAWLESKRRCRLGSGLAGGPGTITFKAGHVGVNGEVDDVCLPIGLRVFSEGDGYFHGGLSLQEAIVPVIVFRAGKESGSVGEKPQIDIRYRSAKFTSRVIGLTLMYRLGQMSAFGNPPVDVIVEAYEGVGAKAALVGKAADCDARDERTGSVRLEPDKDTGVPVLIDPDFGGSEVEIRVSDPGTRVIWARLSLKNAILD